MDHSAKPAIVLVLTTLDESVDARLFAQTLVLERLAACVNVLPTMLSLYRWRGAVESAREQQVVIKTTSARLEALKVRLAGLHPYEVPELIVIPVLETSPTYASWIIDAVS